MKARVIAAEEIVDVHRLCMSSQGDIWQTKSGKEYFAHELDFDVKEPPKPRYNPDYWTKLEHQYAGMVMQGMLSNEYTHKLYLDNKNYPNGLLNDSIKIAHALVEKMKEAK